MTDANKKARFYEKQVEPIRQRHRLAILTAASHFDGNLTALARSLNIQDRQVVHAWVARGKIPQQYVVDVARLAGVDPVTLMGFPRQPYTRHDEDVSPPTHTTPVRRKA